jgi:hypothetical protein
MQNIYKPKAFISCSLRNEDKDFVDLVINLTEQLGFEPFGTVGKYVASPKPLWQQMRDGIKEADCIVMALTPRYIQQDIHDKKNTGQSISEMLHFELGMAVYKGIPIIALGSDDKVYGKLLPSMVSIISFNPTNEADFLTKWPLIQNYFKNAMKIIAKKWKALDDEKLTKQVKSILAFIGAATVVYLFIRMLTKK